MLFFCIYFLYIAGYYHLINKTKEEKIMISVKSVKDSLTTAMSSPQVEKFKEKCGSLKGYYEKKIDSDYTKMIIVASFVAINQLALLDTLGSFACYTLGSETLETDPIRAIKLSSAKYIKDEKTRNMVVETALVVLALSVTRFVVSQILDTKVKPLGFKQTGRAMLASFIMWNAVDLYKKPRETEQPSAAEAADQARADAPKSI